MELLVNNYLKESNNLYGDEFNQFKQFFQINLVPIEDWLSTKFKQKQPKNDVLSANFRIKGNDLYKKKKITEALECYNKSLCYASYNSEAYGMALSNKSALLFSLKNYKNCLKDINSCLKSNYPNKLKPKIYVRQAECYFKLGMYDLMQETISDAIDSIESNSDIEDKDKYKESLFKINDLPKKYVIEDDSEKEHLPIFEKGENEHFAYASRLLKMNYNNTYGRHVLAREDIKRGDLLFVEKAFVFAPVFTDSKNIYKSKCYNCLKDVISSIPCKSCTFSVFCDEKCRDNSWVKYHQWECAGMQANIFCDLGIAFPALKAIFKGISSGFKSLLNNFEEDLQHFGSKSDNYPYFNRLLSHFDKLENTVLQMVLGTTLVLYLQNYTNFFTWLMDQPKCPKNSIEDLKLFIGGLIVKHICQLMANSSIISHWIFNNEDILPDSSIPVACGMYPCLSIMNHSCKPSIALYFIGDVAIVKALHDINKNEQVFNCYGVDYKHMSKKERQEKCNTLYHFTCNCNICSTPYKEFELFDGFLCPKCCKNFLYHPTVQLNTCSYCGHKFSILEYEEKQRKVLDVLQNYSSSESLKEILITAKSIFSKDHSFFISAYEELFLCCLEKADLNEALKYFEYLINILKNRHGKSSRIIGIKLYKISKQFLNRFKAIEVADLKHYKELIIKIEEFIKESKIILGLYYPIEKLHFLNLHANLSNIKSIFCLYNIL